MNRRSIRRRKQVLVFSLIFAAVTGVVYLDQPWHPMQPEASPISEARPQVSEEMESGPNQTFFDQRAFPVGRLDLNAVDAARRQVLQTKAIQSRSGAPLQPLWVQRGPLNIQGRVTAIAVDPTNDQTAYIACAEGGIFRTLSGGNSWSAMFDDQSSLSMGAVAIDPSNHQVIYAGTGEVNPGRGSVAYGGTGLYRSNDQGVSWTHVGLENSGGIGRIAIHPNDPDIIHVAVMGHLWQPSTDRGVYRTTDGGDTWTRVLYLDDTTGCVDIIQRPDAPNVLFAAMWTRIRLPETYDYGGINCGVYRSDDGGVSWALVGNGLPAPTIESGRIGLAICHSNPDVMCAIYASRTGPFTGLYRTTDGGASWSQTNDAALAGVFSSFGWWFGNVRIHPNDPNVIYAVGFDVYRSGDGGNSYAQVGANMHVDHHGFGFGMGSSPLYYACNDGGVYTSTDGFNFSKTTGDLPITQAYRIATAPWDDDGLWIGAQDNGTSQDLNGDGNFAQVFGGDGFQPVPHLVNSQRLWVQYQYGNVYYSSNSGGNWSDARGGLGGRKNWNAPHAQDPNDPETRYFGTHRVYRNDGNTAWTQISNDLTGGPHQGMSGQVDGTLTAISVSPADSQVIWTGSDDGYVYVTQNGGTTWSNVSLGLPERWITSIRPHPSIAAEALVTVSGFRWGEEMSHIYRTSDSGQTWEPIDSNLPDMPVNDVIIDPNRSGRYFAATDIGVFQTKNNGTSWDLFGVGLPNVVVNDLDFRPESRQLFAGTYGRSIFSITVPEISPTQFDVPTGVLSNGGLGDLENDDNQDVSVRRGNSIDSKVVVEFKAVSHSSNPSVLAFRYTASVFARGNVQQQLSLYNYNSGQWEVVDTRNASRFADTTIETVASGDLSRFIEPGTACIEARVEYTGTTPRTGFTANIDQVEWWIEN